MGQLVQFSQNAPVVAHTTLPKSHSMFDDLNVFVFCGRESSCRKVCAHIKIGNYHQEKANWCELVFTSICARKTLKYHHMCGNMRTHARI